MHLNNMTMGRKLWSLVLGLLLAVSVVSGLSQWSANAVMHQSLARVQQAESLITHALNWQSHVALYTDRVVGYIGAREEEVAEFLWKRAEKDVQESDRLYTILKTQASTDAERAQLEQVMEALGRVRSLNGLAQGIRSAELDQQREFALERFIPAATAYSETLRQYVSVQEQARDAAVAQASAASARVVLLALIAMVVLMVLVVLAVSFIVRSITRPLERAVGLAGAIAAGDLTQDIQDTRRDELGELMRALSSMAGRLRGVVGEVRAGVESVSAASSQIATGNQDLSARTEQTAANLEETAASMEELTATVTQSADTARQANQLAATAAQAAQRGGEVVSKVVSSMQQITDSSKKISDIIGVIDGIAFQTNILALNAAVEAASAGEQGRGFAVVAAEVRSLAQRSAEAAKEIKALIATSVDNVDTGSAQVEEAGRTMHDIVQSVERVSDLISEITASATEQRDGIAQVNQAVSHLDQMTQANAALVEESSAAATAMHDQAQRLGQVVSVFNVGTPAGPALQAPQGRVVGASALITAA